MPYFKQVEDPENPGQFKFEEIKDDELELSEDVLKKRVTSHPAYRKVLDESIKRKEKIRELLEDKSEDPDPADPTKPDPKATPQQQEVKQAEPLDEEALYSRFLARMKQETEQQTTAQRERQTLLQGILVRNSLPDDALPLLENAQDPAKMAADLARSNYRFDPTPGGAPAVTDEDELMGKVFERAGLTDKKK